MATRATHLSIAVLAAVLGTCAVTASASVPTTCDGLAVTISGTDNADVINGTSGRDIIHGGGGDDIIKGKGGNDVICGGGGSDEIKGGEGQVQVAEHDANNQCALLSRPW
ncbi:MAG: hypothetical protein AAF184_24630 [Pseudomonadota bacterium]